MFTKFWLKLSKLLENNFKMMFLIMGLVVLGSFVLMLLYQGSCYTLQDIIPVRLFL